MKLLNLLTKRRAMLLLVMLALGWGCSGCGTEAENTAQRPWNSPEGWQNGNAGMIAQPH